jgi:outer membrane protein assembly factor BamB
MLLTPTAFAADWLQFRGQNGAGVSSEAGLPTQWSETENVAWKAPLPGRGLAAPIIIGDLVVVTASSGPRQDRLHVLAFDAATGKPRWERQLWATGRTMTHPKTSVAACTPASDGKRIFATYSTNDVAAFDLAGNLLWFRGLGLDYPNASNSLGMASSPVVVGDTFIQQVENDSESFAIGLDVNTGVNRWKIDRPIRANWTSPAIVRGPDNAPGVLLQSSASLVCVEPATGKPLWTYAETCSTIPSSTVQGDLVFVPSHGVAALRHVPGSQAPEKLWQENKLDPGTSSPVAYGDKLFVISRAGVLKAANLKTGEIAYQLRLKGSFSGTPVIADGKLLVFNEDGEGLVVELGEKEGKIIGGGKLEGPILCTPAVANGAIYVRSDAHLWKIGKK